jgi:GNAT superfamily N-acetyltransferase
MAGMSLKFIIADLAKPAHQQDVLRLVNMYAQDEMGGGRALASDVEARLLDGLRTHPTTIILLAYEDDHAVGIAVCFLGFSTFQAAPLLNVHDLAVAPEARGRGVGRRLLEAVRDEAIRRGCCKITLEVLVRNERARAVYDDFGFQGAGPIEADHSMLFCTLDL